MKASGLFTLFLATSASVVSSMPAGPDGSRVFPFNIGRDVAEAPILQRQSNVTARATNATAATTRSTDDGGGVGKAIRGLLDGRSAGGNGPLGFLNGLVGRADQQHDPAARAPDSFKPQPRANGDGHAERSFQNGVVNIDVLAKRNSTAK